MGKRVTKNDLALQELRNKRDEAKWKVNEADTILKMAHAVYMAYSDAYDKMSASLAPKPRSNGSGSAPKRSRVGRAAASAMTAVVLKQTPCSTCGEADDHSNHDAAYLSSHPFLQSSTAPSAKKRSSSASASKKDGEANGSGHEATVSNVPNVEGNPNEVS